MVTQEQFNADLAAAKASVDAVGVNVAAVLALLAASEAPADFTAQDEAVLALKAEADAQNAQLVAALPPVEAPPVE